MSVRAGGIEPALVATTFVLGLRHGVDWDHLSAISDLTGADLRRRHAAMVAALYAVGHGVAVFALGALAVTAGERLPSWIDPLMERAIGCTLLVLAVAVVRSAWRSSGRPVARGVLLLDALARARARLRRYRSEVVRHAHAHDHDDERGHGHAHRAPERHEDTPSVRTMHRHAHVHQIPVSTYGPSAAFAIGVLHGVGAETGTQAIVLAGAAHASATGAALVVVGAFVLGVVVTTVALAFLSAAGWAAAGRDGRAVRALSIIAGTASGVVGALFVVGAADRLPSILGG